MLRRGLVESGLFSAPIYWVCGFQKNFGKFMIYWMAAYLLNLISSVFFKGCAIAVNTPGVAVTLSCMTQVCLGRTAPKCHATGNTVSQTAPWGTSRAGVVCRPLGPRSPWLFFLRALQSAPAQPLQHSPPRPYGTLSKPFARDALERKEEPPAPPPSRPTQSSRNTGGAAGTGAAATRAVLSVEKDGTGRGQGTGGEGVGVWDCRGSLCRVPGERCRASRGVDSDALHRALQEREGGEGAATLGQSTQGRAGRPQAPQATAPLKQGKKKTVILP